MSGRPIADIRVWNVQDRRSNPKYARPWIVRWAVDAKTFSRGHRTRSEADHYRSLLLVAQRNGQPFDPETGEPEAWSAGSGDIGVHEWCRRWLGESWDEWQPRTRDSAVEALARFIPLLTASRNTPPDLRAYLTKALRPGADRSESHEAWLDRHVPTLAALDRSTLAVVDRDLGTGDAGQALGASTAGRYRKVARSCVRRAHELELIARDPWPPTRRGANQRKARRQSKTVDARRFPDPDTMRRAIDAIESHQPASRTYRVMTAVLYYAGLRPSEVVMLRPSALHLPVNGWGRIDVTEADVAFDVPGEPKTGERTVPIPPLLVALLADWVGARDFADDDLIFRTRNGRRPTASNWSRAWHRALAAVDQEPLRLYDCRHAAATTWLAAGVPLGEAARRLGHSVEVLVSTYVGALDGDVEISNQLIEEALGPVA